MGDFAPSVVNDLRTRALAVAGRLGWRKDEFWALTQPPNWTSSEQQLNEPFPAEWTPDWQTRFEAAFQAVHTLSEQQSHALQERLEPWQKETAQRTVNAVHEGDFALAVQTADHLCQLQRLWRRLPPPADAKDATGVPGAPSEGDMWATADRLLAWLGQQPSERMPANLFDSILKRARHAWEDAHANETLRAINELRTRLDEVHQQSGQVVAWPGCCRASLLRRSSRCRTNSASLPAWSRRLPKE